MKPRIIVCGLDRTGYKVLCLLQRQGANVVGIHHQPIHQASAEIIVGDFQSETVLIEAGIGEAHTLILTSADEAQNLAILMQARVLNPTVRIINRLFNTSLGTQLDLTLPDHLTMSVAALAAPIFAFSAMGGQAIGQLRLFQQIWPIYEVFIDDKHPWLGMSLADLWADRRRMLIYYLPTTGNHSHEKAHHDKTNSEKTNLNRDCDLVSAVVEGRRLNQGDHLLVGIQPQVRSNNRSWLFRFLKFMTNLKQLHKQGQAMLLVALSLLLIIALCTIIYTTARQGISVSDALYFSVGMLTGAGGNEQVVEKGGDWLKYLTVVMMLIGTAVIGIWYALLNDFVLGTRLRQVWDSAHIPERNHFIICGLGSVGMQIASHLTNYGYDVLIVERDPHNRFLKSARSMGLPVILDDASLASTLKAAHLETAEGVLVVTNSDTSNLEIALNARGIDPKSRIVLRYDDPHHAAMAQQVFDFDAVLSPSEIAAPAFAASALGGRILGNGIIADKLWVAIATMITPNHPFCGQLVQDAAMESDFVPLYVETAAQTIHGWDLLHARLNAGDVLYLTIPAAHLDQLWRTSYERQALTLNNF
ncbi:MAG: NAD(P)-binding protein [Pseudanabaena sp. ELA607]